MRAFVTGGSGFVGRNLIPALIDRGHEVVALARSENTAEMLRGLGATPVRGDIHDRDAMMAGMKGCDVVFHLAASTEEWASEEHFRRVNFYGTREVLEGARIAGVKRLVHFSTEAVLLGSGPLKDVDESRPIPRRPAPGYPGSKAEAEEAVTDYPFPDLETVVVRPRFIWGKGDTTLLPKLVDMVGSGRFMWIDGGRAMSSTCHVRNACEGAILAAERGRDRGVYFLTDGPPVQVREFLTALLATQGVTPGHKSVPFWAALALASLAEPIWRLLHVKTPPPVTRTAVLLVGTDVTVSDARARRELGYESRVSREEGLAEMRRH